MTAIADAVARRRYRYTVHGAQQRIARTLTGPEVEQALLGGEIVEDYPQHHLGPAYLILGWTAEGKALHVVCSVRHVVDIITIYQPDLAEWETDLRTRMSK